MDDWAPSVRRHSIVRRAAGVVRHIDELLTADSGLLMPV